MDSRQVAMTTENEVNARLKAAKVGVTVQQMGDRLLLRATLPPSPASKQTRPHQQRISTGIYASAEGYKQIEKLARKLGADLALGQFRWEQWRETEVVKSKAPVLGDWLPKFERDYFDRRGRNERTESTWENEYRRPLGRFDKKEQLTPENIKAMICSIPAEQKTRQRVANAFGCLAKFMGLTLPFLIADFRGTYTSLKPAPRNLPSDDQIVEAWEAIPNPQWRYVFGLIAAFGLRPHEAMRIVEIKELPGGGAIATIDKNTKTGARMTWALHPEWVERFGLLGAQLPNIKLDRGNEKLGHHITVQFSRYSCVPFKLYDLRHAWAARAIVLGIETGLASKMMGHSLAVHSCIYSAHIDERHYKEAYERFIGG